MAIRQCIVIADKARARLFSVEDERDTPFEAARRRFRELRDLVNPEGRLTDQELFSDRRAGRRSRSAVVGAGYGIDDGKDGERNESTRRFARELVNATADLVRSRKPKKLLLVASPRFLGLVRSQMKQAIPKEVEITVLAEDLSRQAPAQIEKVLMRRGVLGARA
jgi:protein required for attachment to host cells